MDNKGDVGTNPKQKKKLGGVKSALFIYVAMGLENVAFIGNAVSIFTYFFGYMNFSLTKSATMLTNYMGTSYVLSLFGGFVCDTYLSRYRSSILFGSVEVLGYAVLAAQAFFKELRPSPCKDVPPLLMNQCESSDSGQVAMLYIGLYLAAIGTGGLKAAAPSLGADQFDEEDPEEAASLSVYFNWLLFSIVTGAIFGVTFLVWVNTFRGWNWGFLVSTLAVLVAVLCLYTGKSVYRQQVPEGSPLARILQVFVVAIINRNLSFPETADGFHDVKHGTGDEILKKTEQFKFFDRAAIIRTTDSSNSDSTATWRTCTVTQVEETKILVRMFPIILSTIFMNTCLAQLQTFSIQQSNTMDRHLLGFEIPGASITVIPFICMFVLIPIYDRICVPALRKLTGIPTGIRHLQRVGIGLVLSIISMVVAGYVEKRRKSVAIDNNLVDSPAPLPISVFWLGFQFAIFGMADMFTLVGLLEFFYSESSKGMKSLGTAISWCSLAFGYYLSSVIVNVVNNVSDGWFISNNLNRDKLSYFFWLLAGLSVLNLGVYLICSSWYKYKSVEMKQTEDKSNVEMETV
ncbi:Proton-dependent oligopeptide transporter [Heracleum sosnowskyi]|uniref:Proton-dependent oligopeptide transporter n=1 Tax=Heracleum sosnowskyi TaxID=360622 RepID=A0AAD8MAM1_9APIA|nr:Proton-dependent oligopeptide transporter [Heracleum sosnowskyi]